MAASPDPKRRYVRRVTSAVALTPIKADLLRLVAEFGLVSLPQLARLIEHREQATRRHMRGLFDSGYVALAPLSRAVLGEAARPGDPSLLFGSAPNCYTLTRKGVGALKAAGLMDEGTELACRAYGPGSSRFVAHALAVADAHVWLIRSAKAAGHALRVWREAGAAEITIPTLAKPRTVRPDAWFVYETPGAVLVGLLEADRATERLTTRGRWSQKLDAYGALFASGHLVSVTGYRNARVLVVTPNEQRAAALCRWVGLHAAPDLAARFWVTTATALEVCDLSRAPWQRPGHVEREVLLGDPHRADSAGSPAALDHARAPPE